MSLIQEFWRDDSGFILSAEAITLGTVGVLGTIVGLNAAGTAVNGELKEMASAIRSLDQSYGYVGHQSCGAWSAGSCYIQPDIQQSLADLSAEGDIHTIQQKVDAQRKSQLPPAPQPQPHVDPTPTPLPNQIPTPESKSSELKEKAASEVVPTRSDKSQS